MYLSKIIKSNCKNYLYDATNNQIVEIDLCISKYLSNNKLTNEVKKFLQTNKIRNVFKPCKFDIAYNYSFQELAWLTKHRISGIILSITQNCNLRCEYCGYMSRYLSGEKLFDMPKTTAFKAIDWLFDNCSHSKFLTISFYGGEPLLNFNLIMECLQYCKHKYPFNIPTFFITTNGILLDNEDIVTFLVENDFNVNISLDGTKEIHDKYRLDINKCPSFDKVMRGITNLYRKSPSYFQRRVSLNTVIIPGSNKNKVYEFLDNMLKADVTLIEPVITDFFADILKNVKAEYDEKPVDVNKYDFIRKAFFKDLHKYHLAFKNKNEFLNIWPGGFCIPGLKKNFITYDGKIILCEKVNENDEIFCIGDVYTGIDNSKLQNLIRETSKKVQKCRSCWAAKFCTLCFKDIYNISDDFCEKYRKKIERDIIYYLEEVRPNKNLVNYFDNLSIY